MKPMTVKQIKGALKQYEDVNSPTKTLVGWEALSGNCVHSARLAVELADALNEVLGLFPEDMSPGDRQGWHWKDKTTDVVTRARAALAQAPAGQGAAQGEETE